MSNPPLDYLPNLRKYFGFSSLRGKQEAVVNALLSKSDVLLTAPTGHGKSLCFQLPALIRHDATPQGCLSIVVTPLVSLMQNQVASLRAKQIPVALLSSAEKETDNRKVLAALSKKGRLPFALLYVTPERVVTEGFLGLLKKLYETQRLGLVAVDEAHSISQWGHDFRKAYGGLGVVKERFPLVPVVALTATATARVKKEIITSLKLKNAVQIHSSFLRENIRYEVRYADAMKGSVEEDIVNYVTGKRMKDGSARFERGIVYAFKRDTVDAVADLLQKHGIPAVAYHGGMNPKKRKEAQTNFEKGVCPVVVASTAFGMGIDVAAIRYVVHHSVPKTVEAFYQESGRAGRDGLPSESVLYYSERDARFNAFLVNKEVAASNYDERRSEARVYALEAMKSYCTKVKCRRVAVLAYFGENTDAASVCGKHGCDVCCDRREVIGRMRLRVTKSRGYGGFRSANSAPATPAAEFQTARSLLKMQKEKKGRDQTMKEKRPRSILHHDAIDDFNSGDEFDSVAGKEFAKLEASGDQAADLRALARAEEANANLEMSRLKRPRDRVMARVKGQPGGSLSSAPNDSMKRRRRNLGSVGFRRNFGMK